MEKGGPIYQLNVLSDGDRARWDIQRPAVRTFGGNSCLDFTQFCRAAMISSHLREPLEVKSRPLPPC